MSHCDNFFECKNSDYFQCLDISTQNFCHIVTLFSTGTMLRLQSKTTDKTCQKRPIDLIKNDRQNLSKTTDKIAQKRPINFVIKIKTLSLHSDKRV